MMPDLFQRFLGVDATADPAALLGLTDGPYDRPRIEAALRRRLEQVRRHPDGNGVEGRRVQQRLREAAAALADREEDARAGQPASPADPVRPRPPRPPAPLPPGPVRPSPPRADEALRRQLTEFDRHVLAILVGCGGWNAQSRAQLVALAGSYGVTAQGLMKVVSGLGEYARCGGPRLGVAEITSGGARFAPRAPRPVRVRPAPTRTAQIGERLSRELAGESVWSTIRLSALFGLLTLVVGFIVLRAALHRETPAPPAEDQAQTAPEAATPAGGAPRPPSEGAAALGTRLARFRPLPTFLGNALPLITTEAADQCGQLPARFDEVARKLSITGDPAEAVYRNWSVSVDTIAIGWVLVDDSTRAAIDGAIDDALHEVADKPSVGDRLLASLLPPSGRFIEPIDVWRGAWQAGTLGSIAGSASLPPAVVERARTQLAVTLEAPVVEAMSDFTTAAGAWLDQEMASLVDVLEYDDRAYDAWEMWIAAQRKLGGGDRLNAAIMSAIRRILQTDTDLARPGPGVNVLGRLLMIADFRKSGVVKDAVARLFDAPGEQVTDHDLWVLTSLLAQLDTAPWFGEDLVLPDGAGKLFRNRIRDRIAGRWPALPLTDEQSSLAQGRGIPVDAGGAERWSAVLERTKGQPPGRGEEELMEQLVIACRVNEAAALLAARKTEEAEAAIAEIEAAIVQSDAAADSTRIAGGRYPPRLRQPPGRPPPRQSGRAIGPDGEWAAAYEEARSSTEDKLKWLQALRANEGSDLGPINAELFVHEVYLGRPQEVRSLARAILDPLLAVGPNVAMEMLDQFPDAPRDESVSETIRRLTGRVLPPARSGTWPAEAQLALLHHALSLRPTSENVIDEMAQLLTESYAERISTHRQEFALALALQSPQEAAGYLAEAWQERAATLMAVDPLPDDLAGLQRRRGMRRRLAEGPIQLLIADQLTVLDYLTYVTVAEQPGLRIAAAALLADSADRRGEAGHVLQQAIEAERAASGMWALRMGLAGQEGLQQEARR